MVISFTVTVSPVLASLALRVHAQNMAPQVKTPVQHNYVSNVQVTKRNHRQLIQ